MRILVVQESDWLEKGPHQSHHLMERLSARGHEIRVIDFEISWKHDMNRGIYSRRTVFDNIRKALPEGGVTVVRPGILRIPLLDYASILVTHSCELFRQIREFRPDVIICFGILNAWISIAVAKKNKIPVAYYVIDELHRLIPQSRLRNLGRAIERMNMRRADCVISINEELRGYTTRMGATSQKTMVIRAGIDSQRFHPGIDGERIRETYGYHRGDTVLFFMGWLYQFSGLLELSERLLEKKEEFGEMKLMVLGKGELWETLSSMSQHQSPPTKIVLIDWKPYYEIPEYIAASDICILPAHKNDIMKNIVPIKLYEYLSMGKPVVATRLPGLEREFGDFSGITYVDSVDELLQAARDISRRRYDEESKRAARAVAENDWDSITSRFEAAISKLSANHKMSKISR